MREWINLMEMDSRKFQCGFCGAIVGSNRGYHFGSEDQGIFICPNCSQPTYFGGGRQYPAPLFGDEVINIPEEIETLYDETRACMSVCAYTPAVLACRKMLMNIAVNKDAKEGKKFIEYVEYLAEKGFIPPDGKKWVDYIRNKGNEANHVIAPMEREDAENLITFIEMLLKIIYEFPSKIPIETDSE